MNDYVWVRLNDRGRDIHRQNFLALFGNLASGTSFEYEAPQAINGWSKFRQMRRHRDIKKAPRRAPE